MADRQRGDGFVESSVEFAALVRATGDMLAVWRVALYIADNDPSFALLRLHAKRSGNVTSQEFERLLDAADRMLRDPQFRTVLETGLIVTYARPFVRGEMSGFPLSRELQRRVVPKDRWTDHQTLLQLRRQVAAHTDTTPSNPAKNEVVHFFDDEAAEWRTQQVGQGGRLTEDGLRRLAELAAAICRNLQAEADALRPDEHARLPSATSEAAQPDEATS